MSLSPFIFIIDLDGTIIGDCSYQVLMNNIDDLIKENNGKIINKGLLSSYYDRKSKLIRPYFVYFINEMKKYNPKSQFYIYTASETEWANKEISYIEKGCGIKFNRPLFTRKDCIIDSDGFYKKSVKKIFPQIQKNNKGSKISLHNILVIDNNKVFIDCLSNFILCPSYEQIVFCDLWKKIKVENLQKESIKQHVEELISLSRICQYNDDTLDDIDKESQHKWFFKKYKKINKHNKKFSKDLFWKKITDSILINNIRQFDKVSVKLCYT